MEKDKELLPNEQGHTDKELEASYRGCFFTSIGIVVLAIIALLALSSCTTTKYVEVPVVKTDTLIVTDHQRDSVWVHDSTYIHERGDTVWVERWHTRWRDRMLMDTIYRATHDTVPKPYPVEKEVPAQLSPWQNFRIYLGNIAIFATIILLIIFLIKQKLKL